LITYSLASGGTSVAALFMAGYIPGIIWAMCCCVVGVLLAVKLGYKGTPGKFDWKNLGICTLRALPSLSLIIVVIGHVHDEQDDVLIAGQAQQGCRHSIRDLQKGHDPAHAVHAYVLCGHHRRPAAGHLYPGGVYRTAAGNGPDVTETFPSSPKKGGICFAAGTAFSCLLHKGSLVRYTICKGRETPCADGLF